MKIIKLRQTTNFSPCQWEGILENGMRFYVHYRFGLLGVGQGKTIKKAVSNYKKVKVLGCNCDGILSKEEMLRVLKKKFDWIYKTL